MLVRIDNINKNNLRISLIAVTTIIAVVVSLYCLSSGWFIIFQNLFYIPIIISCMYYAMRGFIYSTGLAIIYFLLILLFAPDNNTIMQALIRVGLFIAVGGIITFLSLQRKRLEKTLNEERKKFRTVANFTYDWVYWTGPKQNLIFVSPSCKRISGYSSEEFMADRNLIYSIVHFDDQGLFRGHTDDLHGIRADEIGEIEFRIVNRNNEERWIYHQCQPVYDGKGNLIGRCASNRDITERKQMEEMLSEREEKFRTIFDKAGNGILLADAITKRFIEGNTTICTMLGYSKEEIMNLTVYDIHPPQDISRVLDEFDKQFKKEKLISEDVPVLRKDGSIFYADIDSVPITIGRTQYLVGIFRDITLQKQSEALLKQSEERFRDLYENAPNAYFSVGVDGIIRRCNLQAEKLLGCKKEEIIGRHVFEIYADTPNGKEKAKKVFERFRKGDESINEELQFKDVRGNILWARLTVNIVKDEHGKIIESRSIVLDITEQKRLEQQLQTMSFTDELSGLYNRRGFITLSEQQIKIVERTKKNMLLFFVDLDKMKQINDTLGHQEGDKALIDISNILKEVFRESDIIGRIGGDEFAVLALNTTNDTKDFLIKRLHDTIDNYNSPEGRNYQLSLSLGIAHYDPEKPSSLDELMARADELMYEEKSKKQA